MTVTPGDDPAVFGDRVFAELGAVRLAGTLLGVGTPIWAGVVGRSGLEHGRGLSAREATAVAATAALLWPFGALL